MAHQPTWREKKMPMRHDRRDGVKTIFGGDIVSVKKFQSGDRVGIRIGRRIDQTDRVISRTHTLVDLAIATISTKYKQTESE